VDETQNLAALREDSLTEFTDGGKVCWEVLYSKGDHRSCKIGRFHGCVGYRSEYR